MIEGKFGSKGELIFEIDLIADEGLIITVVTLLDTGCTDWLAINNLLLILRESAAILPLLIVRISQVIL